MRGTIREQLAYFKEEYGRVYRIHIENSEGVCRTYYWWEYHDIPNDIFELTPKRVRTGQYYNKYGIRAWEMEFLC